MRTFRIGLLISIFFAVGLTTVASADLLPLLSLPGIPGGFSQGQYMNWIECAGFEHNVPGLPGPMALCSGTMPQQEITTHLYRTGNRRPDPGDSWPGIILTKEVDKSTPKLIDACKRGTEFAVLKMLLFNPETRKAPLSMRFENVSVAYHTVMAPGFGDRSQLVRRVDDSKAIELLYLLPEKVSVTMLFEDAIIH